MNRNRKLLEALAWLCIGLPAFIAIAVFGRLPPSIHAQEPKKLEAKVVRWVDTPASATARRELTLRERREMGLTVLNIAQVARELKQSGDIDAQTSQAEIAAAIAIKLESKNPQAFGAGVDWDAILAFIERLLPLILKLIALF